MKKKIVVLMGGFSSEFEVSLASGNEVIKNLNKEKYDVCSQVLANNENGIKIINKEWVEKMKPDVVFIAMHGKFGEDGTIQKILEDLKVKYTGCGPEASKMGIDKYFFKKLMEKNELLTPKWKAVKKGEIAEWQNLTDLSGKLVVKPTDQGSSVGVSIVDNKENFEKAVKEAFNFSDSIIIEEFIGGMEVSCGVIGNEEVQVLPIIEICPKNKFFDYEAKYTDGRCEEIVPARIPVEVANKVSEITAKIYKIVGCRGFARVDFIIRNGIPYILEINTIPGLTPNSLVPKEAKALGISYGELLDKIIDLALEN